MRILIIDRQSKVCQSRKTELDTWFQASVIRQAANACEALHLLEEYQPDIFLVDVRIPTGIGLEAIRLIKAKYRTFIIVAISLNSDLKVEALAAGVDTFISKNDPPERLLEPLAKELCVKNLVPDRNESLVGGSKPGSALRTHEIKIG